MYGSDDEAHNWDRLPEMSKPPISIPKSRTAYLSASAKDFENVQTHRAERTVSHIQNGRRE
jgi:hypothetical protein